MRARVTDQAFVALAGAAAMLFAADALLLHNVRGLQGQTEALKGAIVTDLGHLRYDTAAANDEHHDAVAALTAALAAARDQTLEAAGSARAEAQGYAERLAHRLALSGRRRQQWIGQELLHLRTQTAAANDATRRLAGQLQEARTATSSARTGNAVAELETRILASDARALAGIAARQRDDIERVRAGAANDIFEFDLKKSSAPREIAGLSLLLRHADPKRGRYSLAIVTRAGRIEANDREALEPLRLYPSGGRRALELVVSQVGKDEIRGYIAAPRSYSSGSAEIASFPGR
ncbi:MAG: hypothetical protein ACM336_12955 [Acidobacteriota bacterium]